MKDLLLKFLTRVAGASRETKIVALAGALLMAAIAGYSVWSARNPTLEPFQTGLTNEEFALMAGALEKAAIRFDASRGGAPYTLYVESGRELEATAAIARDGAYAKANKGIDLSASASPFASADERKAAFNKQHYQEVESQLDTLDWVYASRVLAGHRSASIGKYSEPTVAVTLTLRGYRPTREQAQTVASLVQRAFNTSADKITISDEDGNRLFNGEADDGLSERLAYERAQSRELTYKVQDMLDRIYGPGMTLAEVYCAFDWTRTERVDEEIPKGTKISESSFESSAPGNNFVGGPAGVAGNIDPADGAGTGEAALSTRTEKETRYATGNKTTYVVQDQPVRTKVAVSLVFDDSISDSIKNAADLVKPIVGFDSSSTSLDTIATHTTKLRSIERDEEGNPVVRAPEEAPSRANPMIALLLEHGVEVVSAVFFLFLLARALKGSKSSASKSPVATVRKTVVNPDGTVSTTTVPASEATPDIEDLDPEFVARIHVEELLKSEPERISALLSRWAMGEDFYTSSKS